MKKIALAFCAVILSSCAVIIGGGPGKQTVKETTVKETVKEVKNLPNGTLTCNLPCKTVYIHQEKPGKSIVLLWLHGGVQDVAKHDLFAFNHLDCVKADEYLLDYLEKKGIKAIALFPVCHKSNLDHAVSWKDCYPDVKRIIDDYINMGLVDVNRIYLTGSSDGGTGVWDYAENYPDMFCVGLALSCGRPRMTKLPVYFYNTNSEKDYAEQVKELQQQGSNIVDYQHLTQYKHGGDAEVCTEAFLDKFFSYKK